MLFNDLDKKYATKAEMQQYMKDELKSLLLILFKEKSIDLSNAKLDPYNEDFYGEFYLKERDPRNAYFATANINLQNLDFNNLVEVENYIQPFVEDFSLELQNEKLESDAHMFFPYIKNEPKNIEYLQLKKDRITIKFVLDDYDFKCLNSNYYIKDIKSKQNTVVY